MPEGLSREVRKLEARFEGFLKDEEDFVKGLRSCLEKFKELVDFIKRVETRTDSERVKELMALRLEATKTFRDALQRESRAEHEKSHILESYGALVLALEEQFQIFY